MRKPNEVKDARDICQCQILSAVIEFRKQTGFNVASISVTDCIDGMGDIQAQAVTVEVKL